LAGIFSLAILFLIKHPDLLQASVLNSSEISLIQKNKWEIAYKQNNNTLDIFYDWSYWKKPITLILAHNDWFFLDISNISWQCNFTVIDTKIDSTKITLECFDIDKNESAIIIPFQWLPQDVLIEEAYYTSEKNKNNLSIWNISSITEHRN